MSKKKPSEIETESKENALRILKQYEKFGFDKTFRVPRPPRNGGRCPGEYSMRSVTLVYLLFAGGSLRRPLPDGLPGFLDG